MTRPRKASRGASLVEAMVALAVMAFGMMAVVGTQSAMRQNAEIARQRSEATRIAQAAMEAARGFTDVEAVPGRPAWEGIASLAAADVVGQSSNTTFRLRQTVTDNGDAALKTLRVSVTWKDRYASDAENQEVVLTSVMSATAPGLAGVLSTPPSASAIRRPAGRNVSIPIGAREMGNGSSAFQPRPGGTVVWVFNNISGMVTGVCTVPQGTPIANVSASMLAGCSNNTAAQVLSGHVRFILSASTPVSATQAEDPPGPALNLELSVALTSTGHPEPAVECFTDAPETASAAALQRYVGYHCLVRSNSSGSWSGTSELVPRAFSDVPDGAWALGTTSPAEYRVCRYTTARSADDTVPNTAHPRVYGNVTGNLMHQNFLVMPGLLACPTDLPASPASGNFVDANTLPHQPPV